MRALITLLLFILGLNCFSQDCASNIQFKQGATLTSNSYNAKDKLQGYSKSTCLSVSSSGDNTTATMRMESFDTNWKLQNSSDFVMSCQKGLIVLDIKMAIPSQSNSQMGEMEMKIDGDNLEFPSSLSVGQQLKDAKAVVTFSSSKMPMQMAMDFFITNRKVEAKESMTISGTSYECYKISYDTESVMNMMGMKNGMKGKVVEWYCPEIGQLKSMSYDKDGKLMGYTVVTDIKK